MENGQPIGPVGPAAPVVVARPGMLSSRKTKLQCFAYVAYGLVMFASIQWPEVVTKELAAIAMAGIAWVTKGNIDGIATEDAAKWMALGNGVSVKTD